MSNIIKEISKDKPTGIDYKYEDSYLEIESEIDKLMSASNAGDVDWNLIQKSSEEILKSKSKDLKIASYWLYSQWQLSSLDGLILSLPLYVELLKTYELKLFPKSKKVKLRILEWLEENLSVAIMKIINEVDEEQIKVLKLNLKALDGTIVKIFKEETSAFSSLLRKIDKRSKEKKELQESTVKEEIIEKTNVSSPKKDDKPSLKESKSYSSLTHKKVIIESLDKVTNISENDYLLFELSFLLGTHLLSLSFDKNEQLNRSKFPSEKELLNLESIENEEEIIDELKVLLSIYPCWLKGYSLLFNNINNIDNIEQAEIYLNTLKYNLVKYLNTNLEFLYKYTPNEYEVVDNELKKWVNLEKKSLIFNNKNSDFEKKYLDACELIKEKKNKEAIELIDNMEKNSKSSEESFLWTLKQVEIAMEIGNKNLSVALLLNLNKEIEIFNIDKWNPKLAIKTYILLLNPSFNKNININIKESIYEKLCRLSPRDASEVSFL